MTAQCVAVIPYKKFQDLRDTQILKRHSLLHFQLTVAQCVAVIPYKKFEDLRVNRSRFTQILKRLHFQCFFFQACLQGVDRVTGPAYWGSTRFA